MFKEPTVAIQKIDTPDTQIKTGQESCIIAQEFIPDEYAYGKRFEIVIPNSYKTTLQEVCEQVILSF